MILATSLHSLKVSIARNTPKGHKNKRVFQKFDEKTDLMYFGTVDQQNDEHHVIRGLSASSTHKDDHYSVGTYEGYDLSIVYRQDTHIDLQNKMKEIDLVIVEIKLENSDEIPPILIQSKTKLDRSKTMILSSIHKLKPIKLGTFEDYGQDFTSRYDVLTLPDKAIETQQLIPAKIARIIGAHFWPLSAEINGGYIYMYGEKEKITEHLLKTMVNDGIWLAKQFDVYSFQ